jgi:hypothetical protein
LKKLSLVEEVEEVEGVEEAKGVEDYHVFINILGF